MTNTAQTFAELMMGDPYWRCQRVKSRCKIYQNLSDSYDEPDVPRWTEGTVESVFSGKENETLLYVTFDGFEHAILCEADELIIIGF